MNSEKRSRAVPLRRHGSGFVAEGAGFYIWDEDARGLRIFARMLEGSAATVPQGAKLKKVRPGQRESRTRIETDQSEGV